MKETIVGPFICRGGLLVVCSLSLGRRVVEWAELFVLFSFAVMYPASCYRTLSTVQHVTLMMLVTSGK